MVRSHRREQAPAQPESVHRITDARRSHAEDMHDRFVKYTVSMSVRMVCIVLAIVLHGWLQWVMIAGAVVLPYVAVLIANAGREQNDPAPDTWGVPHQALGSSAGPAPGGGTGPVAGPSGWLGDTQDTPRDDGSTAGGRGASSPR